MQFCKSIKYIDLNSLLNFVYLYASSSMFFHESLENSLSDYSSYFVYKCLLYEAPYPVPSERMGTLCSWPVAPRA
jgi:hypothetical protein